MGDAQLALAGTIAIVAGIVGSAIYIPRVLEGGQVTLRNAFISLVSIGALALGIAMLLTYY